MLGVLYCDEVYVFCVVLFMLIVEIVMELIVCDLVWVDVYWEVGFCVLWVVLYVV